MRRRIHVLRRTYTYGDSYEFILIKTPPPFLHPSHKIKNPSHTRERIQRRTSPKSTLGFEKVSHPPPPKVPPSPWKEAVKNDLLGSRTLEYSVVPSIVTNSASNELCYSYYFAGSLHSIVADEEEEEESSSSSSSSHSVLVQRVRKRERASFYWMVYATAPPQLYQATAKHVEAGSEILSRYISFTKYLFFWMGGVIVLWYNQGLYAFLRLLQRFFNPLFFLAAVMCICST